MFRFAIAFTLLLIVAALYWRFPYAVDNEWDIRHLIYLVLLLLSIIFTSSLIKRRQLSQVMRDGALWIGIIAILIVSYSYRDAFSRRLLGELIPQQAHERSDGSIEVRASEGGHFFIEARVNETYVRFMIDTGASDIVLSPTDARRAGLNLEALSYDRSYSTANGYGSGAQVTLDNLTIGSLSMSHLPASVNKVDMGNSLLGMSFLKRLSGFRMEDNTLVLIP